MIISIVGIGITGHALETSFKKRDISIKNYDKYKEIGKIYNDVAVIQHSYPITVQTSVFGERTFIEEGVSHWVKSEGYWRWFLSPGFIEKMNKEKE